ncbi:HET-domain-containing protein [Xylaria digitata]|nr:HET-domain-containing protein [Xylaria digitata]
MALNILNESSIMDWLQKRKDASRSLKEAWLIGEPRRWLEERRAFPSYTSSSPHSCKHCRNIIINLKDNQQKGVRLPYNLSESILASREGCALYQILVDYAFKSPKEEAKAAWRGDAGLSYWIEYSPEDLPYNTAQLRFMIIAHSHDGTEHVLNAVGGSSVWTLEGDPATVDISTRPYELNYQSSTSTAWGLDCIKYCQMNHSECRGSLGGDGNKEIISTDSIPSRLLKLIQTGTSILHAQIIGRDMENPIPMFDVSHQGFAILSYCWGGSQPIQLTRETIKLASTYPTTALPKTLADAAWFTHQLGLEYLWVDALCILQDDVDDKGREIPRMGQYYGDATVTICAASADTCFRGFLMAPTPSEDSSNYLFGPVELRVKTTRGELGTIQVLKEADYFSAHREREPIVKRGWTLQESLLSRRLLIFSSHHLYFSCREANASCGGREPLPKSRFIGVYESRVPGISTISSLQRMYPAVNTWDKVVNEYTRRLLGCFDDKLPAISAMAASLVRLARDERAQELHYCAGLMLDLEGKDKGWKGEFLWAVTQPASNIVEPDHSSYPSWSWASLQAPINRWGANSDDFPDEDGIRLLDFNVPLRDTRNPFGAVIGGLVKLMARTRLLSTINRATLNMLVSRKVILEDEVYDESSRSVLVLRSDTVESDRIIACGGQGILLVELIATRTKGTSSTYPAGLLVLEAGGDTGASECYKRVGMFEFRYKDVSGAKNGKDLALKQARALFGNSKLREIYIL